MPLFRSPAATLPAAPQNPAPRLGPLVASTARALAESAAVVEDRTALAFQHFEFPRAQGTVGERSLGDRSVLDVSGPCANPRNRYELGEGTT